MDLVESTAPGKIILFGEHAVVYGRPAIAVPLTSVRARATLQPAEAETGFRLIAPDLGRTCRLDEAAPDDPLALMVRNTLRHLEQAAPPDVTLTVQSTIPLGRGLGSGAAISTAVVRAIANFFARPLPPETVSALVYEVEKLYHGTPSGVDNTVIAFEQPVFFIKEQPLQRLRLAQPFTLVVGDTGVIAPTHQVVGDLRRRWQTAPAWHENCFDRIAVIVAQARRILERKTAALADLGRLMDENQALLETIGVSSPELARLVAAARQAGALGAKLSGAGWGGNMIALAPPQPDAAAVIAQALTKAGALAVLVTEVK